MRVLKDATSLRRSLARVADMSCAGRFGRARKLEVDLTVEVCGDWKRSDHKARPRQ